MRVELHLPFRLARSALPPLVCPRLRLRFELLRFFLLLRREHSEDVAVQPCLLDRHIRLRRGEILGGGTHQRFVDRDRLDSGTLRFHRLLQALGERLRLLAVTLRDVSDLLLLRITQIELTEREAGGEAAPEGSAGPSEWGPAASAAIRPLRRKSRGATANERDEPRAQNEFSKTGHSYLHHVRRCV